MILMKKLKLKVSFYINYNLDKRINWEFLHYFHLLINVLLFGSHTLDFLFAKQSIVFELIASSKHAFISYFVRVWMCLCAKLLRTSLSYFFFQKRKFHTFNYFMWTKTVCNADQNLVYSNNRTAQVLTKVNRRKLL